MRLIFSRGPGRDFSERDLALLTLLRPHLRQAYLDAEHRRRGAPQLTPGSGSCCAWSPPGTPTPRSPASSACRRELYASTYRTFMPGCGYPAALPQSPARSQTPPPCDGKASAAVTASSRAISQLSHGLAGRHRTRADGLDIERSRPAATDSGALAGRAALICGSVCRPHPIASSICLVECGSVNVCVKKNSTNPGQSRRK